MRRGMLILLFAVVAHSAACAYGFYDGSGKPFPSPTYWGWQCADGSQYDVDAGCPPTGPCADLSFPSTDDGGNCVCSDGVMLPSVDCQSPGPCADGSYPTLGNLAGTCACADGTVVPSTDCETPDGG